MSGYNAEKLVMSLDKDEKENEENVPEEEHKEKLGEDTTLIELMCQDVFNSGETVKAQRRIQNSVQI